MINFTNDATGPFTPAHPSDGIAVAEGILYDGKGRRFRLKPHSSNLCVNCSFGSYRRGSSLGFAVESCPLFVLRDMLPGPAKLPGPGDFPRASDRRSSLYSCACSKRLWQACDDI